MAAALVFVKPNGYAALIEGACTKQRDLKIMSVTSDGGA